MHTKLSLASGGSITLQAGLQTEEALSASGWREENQL